MPLPAVDFAAVIIKFRDSIMNKFIVIGVTTVLLAGCESRAVTDTTGGGTPTTGTPASGTITVGDLQSAALDTSTNELTVQITLDADDLQQSYGTGAPDGDYRVYTLQNTPSDRAFTAFSGVSTDESVQAVVVMDGGQFNRFFGGATATQVNYVAPTGGIVNYAGDYVGLLNIGPAAGPGLPGSVSATPYEASTVTGEVYLKADFTDAAVNGTIYNRSVDVGGGAEDMPELVLVVGDIGADGSFSGSIELIDQEGVGNYSGVFGGTDATAVAGVVELTGGFLPGAIPADGNEREFGIFVLDQQVAP